MMGGSAMDEQEEERRKKKDMSLYESRIYSVKPLAVSLPLRDPISPSPSPRSLPFLYPSFIPL